MPVQQPAQAVLVPAPVQAVPAPNALPVQAPAALPVSAFRRNIDILLVFFAFATTIFAWAGAGTSWALDGPVTYYLAYYCASGNSFCASYLSLPNNINASFANVQGACACLVLCGLATLSICVIALVRLIAPTMVSSMMTRMGAHPDRGDLLTLIMLRTSFAAFILAMIGTTLPSVALYPLALNGPGVGLGIVNVIICAFLAVLLIAQSCAPRIPAAAGAVTAIGSVDIKVPTVHMGGAQAPVAPVSAPAQGVVYTSAVVEAAPVPAPVAAPAAAEPAKIV